MTENHVTTDTEYRVCSQLTNKLWILTYSIFIKQLYS